MASIRLARAHLVLWAPFKDVIHTTCLPHIRLMVSKRLLSPDSLHGELASHLLSREMRIPLIHLGIEPLVFIIHVRPVLILSILLLPVLRPRLLSHDFQDQRYVAYR